MAQREGEWIEDFQDIWNFSFGKLKFIFFSPPLISWKLYELTLITRQIRDLQLDVESLFNIEPAVQLICNL